MRKMMEEVEEEGDVEEVNYIDGQKGKIWRKSHDYAMMIKELLNERKVSTYLIIYFLTYSKVTEVLFACSTASKG